MERTTENSIFRDFFDEININKEIKNSCTTQIIAAALFSRNGFKNDLATDKIISHISGIKSKDTIRKNLQLLEKYEKIIVNWEGAGKPRLAQILFSKGFCKKYHNFIHQQLTNSDGRYFGKIIKLNHKQNLIVLQNKTVGKIYTLDISKNKKIFQLFGLGLFISFNALFIEKTEYHEILVNPTDVRVCEEINIHEEFI